ncbi:TRAP transporter large permease subunit [Azospirillum sp. RWY-5-1]|uniref:TRAP transporter large permease protein n=1 Tax=Azospirillum oleiclasticum TaxID=2735135 RepID=A0ABX2TJM4_9PROT|nr:TRAP transporter large permease subunit [Azospirillum oleiclasticum]NYZ17005.1 TRAP transporter large permease subunit [Azospirillum oleiclasticum]NYZ24551.1 TRAP transporter large permease subunit [Azospirillum oleiclasticum]
MDQGLASAVVIIAMFAMLAAGVWVALALAGVGFVAMLLFTERPIGMVMATNVWGATASWTLTALPLFIWMGDILFRTRISSDMFRGLAPWLGWLPGRLMHVNIVGCSIFAAVSGSSAATAATIGKMTIPELTRRGYDSQLIVGSLAGAGTLGLLIPPSIIMIVYGVAADVSIARLFIAGVLPGILLTALFMAVVAGWSMLHPDRVPPPEPPTSLMTKIRETGQLIPVMLLIAGVLGSIYAGIATPTEAAAVGVAGSLLLAAVTGSLSWATFRDSVIGAAHTSCMIGFILAGAAFLTVAMGYTGIPRALADMIAHWQLSTEMLLVVLTLFFIVMGCFLDGISMVVLTTSVILPMVQAAGIDLLWFGIYIVIVVEMAQITPPVGFNLFVLQSMTGKDILTIGKASLPFFLAMCLMVALLWIMPGLVTWLPSKMIG